MFAGWTGVNFAILGLVVLAVLVGIAALVVIIKALLPDSHRHDARIRELERIADGLDDED